MLSLQRMRSRAIWSCLRSHIVSVRKLRSIEAQFTNGTKSTSCFSRERLARQYARATEDAMESKSADSFPNTSVTFLSLGEWSSIISWKAFFAFCKKAWRAIGGRTTVEKPCRRCLNWQDGIARGVALVNQFPSERLCPRPNRKLGRQKLKLLTQCKLNSGRLGRAVRCLKGILLKLANGMCDNAKPKSSRTTVRAVGFKGSRHSKSSTALEFRKQLPIRLQLHNSGYSIEGCHTHLKQVQHTSPGWRWWTRPVKSLNRLCLQQAGQQRQVEERRWQSIRRVFPAKDSVNTKWVATREYK